MTPCDKYGIVYDCYEAHDACPLEWHLPSEDDFRTLANTVGYEKADYMLKSVNERDGLDVYGFSALTFNGFPSSFLGNGCSMDLGSNVSVFPSCGRDGFIRCLKD